MTTNTKSAEQESEIRDEKTTKSKKVNVPTLVVALVLVAVLVPVFIGIFATAGKASEAIGGTVDQSSSTPSGKTPAPTPPVPTAAHVGSTLSIKDQEGNPMDITLVKVVDPITSGDPYLQPDNGKRFVAVQLKLTNTGTNAINESTYNDTTAYDAASQSYSSDATTLDDSCQLFADGSVKLSPGSSALGCVGFQIPSGTKLAKLQFTPSSGFSSSTGEWLVP